MDVKTAVGIATAALAVVVLAALEARRNKRRLQDWGQR